MFPLRRVCNPLRKPRIWVSASKICSAETETARQSLETAIYVHTDVSSSLKRFFSTRHNSPKLLARACSFSSVAGTESSGEDTDDLEDGFSELETSVATTPPEEPDLSEVDNEDNDEHRAPEDLGLLETEGKVVKKSTQKTYPELYRAILDAPGFSVHKVVDKWVEDGNELTKSEIASTALNLRKRKMFGRALQLSEWLETHGHEFGEREHASRLDLIAKVQGLQKAEKYIGEVPKPFQGEHLYRTLLANCVSVANVKKSEAVFNKMKDLGLPVTSFACNQLLLLYKRCDKKKIADVLLLMEKEDIKPSAFTYRILIDTKGQSNDIAGMEKIVETMMEEGIEPDFQIKCVVARHYISAGLKEKAETLLKEMEGIDIKENRWAVPSLLPLYADLGKVDEVRRIWELCEAKPRLKESLSAIEAWGKLNNIEEAEAVFNAMAKKWSRMSSTHYTPLLKVYTNHKLLDKGRDLVKQMADNNCYIGPLTWDALVKLHVDAGEVGKADSILHKAAEQNRLKPLFSSYMAIMDQYAKNGDVHNAEKLFHRMRKVGYVSRLRQFQCLADAYINAKTPAYGFPDRMKADNIFPNRALGAQLAQIDPFKKTAASDLLD